ncbi:hypothetical protein [Saccharothrix xinjiangensis]|uniref:Type III secretion system (T3SS) SseB-like protein n=1 Tax=Saccharothrix xinjiangensis TaxID=204798 RepID=A0ABV9YCS3_9PSEU
MADRTAALVAAGLEVLGTVDLAGDLAPADAWRRVVSGAARPAVEVPDDADDPEGRVDAEWRELARRHGVLADDGTFLISPPGPGAFTAPWTAVRLTDRTDLARHLTANPGEPEFVTASADGTAVLGVTTEEYATWLVLA